MILHNLFLVSFRGKQKPFFFFSFLPFGVYSEALYPALSRHHSIHLIPIDFQILLATLSVSVACECVFLRVNCT